MRERMLTGWTIQRALFVVIGGALIIQSAMDKQWVGVFLGGYFASMGLFAFGCAAGNCIPVKDSIAENHNLKSTITDVDYQEIINK